MTKEEKIKEAWGDLLNKLSEKTSKYILNNNGQVNIYILSKEDRNLLLENCDIRSYKSNFECTKTNEGTKFMFRPKSLKGIEDNNGWISLLNNKEEFYDYGEVELFNINTRKYYFCTDRHEPIELNEFTHFKPFERSKYPLF